MSDLTKKEVQKVSALAKKAGRLAGQYGKKGFH
jgi:hypothetical protein